jgi:hypothetical protein
LRCFLSKGSAGLADLWLHMCCQKPSFLVFIA